MSLRDFSLVRFSVFVSSVKSEQMRPDIHHSFHSRLIVRRDGRPIFFAAILRSDPILIFAFTRILSLARVRGVVSMYA